MDTGASFTTLPSRLLRELGIEPMGKRGFLLADGRRIEMDYGEARATIDGDTVTTIVVFGEDDAPPIAGGLHPGRSGLGGGPGSSTAGAHPHDPVLSPNPPKDTDGRREESGRGVRAVGRDGPRSIPINGAGGGLWLSLGAPMAVLGSGAGAGSAGQYAGEDNRGPGRCDSVGRLGSLVDGSGAVGAVRQAMAGLAIEPGRE